MSPTTPVHSGFPRIGDYAFLSDCQSCALVAPDGSVEWFCLPRFDSPSIFGSLLDRQAGYFRVGPDDTAVPLARRYDPGTNVLETTWMTPSGWLVVRDALTIGPWRDGLHEGWARPPTDEEAECSLVRTFECLGGDVEVEIICAPRFDYGRVEPSWSYIDQEGLGVVEAGHDGVKIQLTGSVRLGIERDEVRGRHTLAEGEKGFCALTWEPNLEAPADTEDAEKRVAYTRSFWRHWLAGGTFPDHPWRVYLQRSALALKGLTYVPTGAAVAAATTSLPETPGGERNWDYRFTWIRDATFTLWALHTLGYDDEARDFMEFIGDVCQHEDLQIMYGIDGRKELTEETLDHLTGYEGAKPVRIGNAAYQQRQNDVYGALLDSIYLHSKMHNQVPSGLYETAALQVEAAAKAWHEPDQGIWEARGKPRHYTSSKLMCWVALDRGARLAERVERPIAERWQQIAGEIREDILANAVSERGVFRQHYETDALDASTLLIPLVRFLPADDERVRATVLTIADELTEHGMVLRYRVEETDDGLHGEEGTFAICSFWLASALSEIGESDRARDVCERMLGH
ncbi:MAG: glycoside hydrolase family 15 protein, partial [Solirubrobacterales bacterium]